MIVVMVWLLFKLKTKKKRAIVAPVETYLFQNSPFVREPAATATDDRTQLQSHLTPLQDAAQDETQEEMLRNSHFHLHANYIGKVKPASNQPFVIRNIPQPALYQRPKEGQPVVYE